MTFDTTQFASAAAVGAQQLAKQMAAFVAALQQQQKSVQVVKTLAERLAEMDYDLVRLELELDQIKSSGPPRNRQERRAERYGHRQPRWGTSGWKGQR